MVNSKIRLDVTFRIGAYKPREPKRPSSDGFIDVRQQHVLAFLGDGLEFYASQHEKLYCKMDGDISYLLRYVFCRLFAQNLG